VVILMNFFEPVLSLFGMETLEKLYSTVKNELDKKAQELGIMMMLEVMINQSQNQLCNGRQDDSFVGLERADAVMVYDVSILLLQNFTDF
jgi:hypothetical protein